MTWTLEGDCSHCGECCKETSVPFMTGGDWIHERPFGCIYLDETIIAGEPKFRCLVLEGLLEPTQEQKKWIEENCYNFPDPNDEGHLPPRYNLPAKCTYRLIEHA